MNSMRSKTLRCLYLYFKAPINCQQIFFNCLRGSGEPWLFLCVWRSPTMWCLGMGGSWRRSVTHVSGCLGTEFLNSWGKVGAGLQKPTKNTHILALAMLHQYKCPWVIPPWLLSRLSNISFLWSSVKFKPFKYPSCIWENLIYKSFYPKIAARMTQFSTSLLLRKAAPQHGCVLDMGSGAPPATFTSRKI